MSQPAAAELPAESHNEEAMLTPPTKPKRKSRFEPEGDKNSSQAPTPAKQDNKQRKDGKWDMFAEADTFGNQYSVSIEMCCRQLDNLHRILFLHVFFLRLKTMLTHLVCI